jgi:hypothetical protein
MPVREALPTVNQQKLEALTKSEPSPPASQPAQVAKEKAPDLSKADEKLSSLLGKK